ncbi:hypothetical protein AB5I41_04195 [Sphingomonas sp. MMS24-JH45]
MALFRGDLRYAGEVGDLYTDALEAKRKANLERDLAALRAIDRSKLSAVDRIAYDVFRSGQERI